MFVDLLTEQAILFEDELGSTPEYTDVPENMRDLVKEKRAEMVERIAELDDDLTLKYLEGEELTIEEMKAALRRGVLNNEVSPVFAGSSLKNKGVQPFAGCCGGLPAFTAGYARCCRPPYQNG